MIVRGGCSAGPCRLPVSPSAVLSKHSFLTLSRIFMMQMEYCALVTRGSYCIVQDTKLSRCGVWSVECAAACPTHTLLHDNALQPAPIRKSLISSHSLCMQIMQVVLVRP